MRKAFCRDCRIKLSLVSFGYSHNGICANCGEFNMLHGVEINGGDTTMKQAWGTNEILEYLRGELDSKRRELSKRVTELDCYAREINDLEEMIFKIERESESQG